MTAINELKPVRTGQDWGYGKTPEDALWSILQKHSAFSPNNAEYIDDRPELMDVTPKDFHRHDWTQYNTSPPHGSPDLEDGIIISERDKTDPRSKAIEHRKQFSVKNVWLEVDTIDFDTDRARVAFRFGLQLRECEWNGDDAPRADEKLWNCNRLSTELID